MSTTIPLDPALQRAVAAADDLVAEGRRPAAIDLLVAANRSHRSAEVERRLVDLRHRSFAAHEHGPVVDFRPPTAVPLDRPGELDEISAADLTAEAFRAGFARQGCVLVRNLIPEDEALRLGAGIDAALDAFDRADLTGADHDDDGWFSQFTPTAGTYRVGGRRKWVRKSGAVWTADSPRMFFELLELVDRTGVGAVVTEYLGERPALSANKCTLRRVPLDTNVGWHQDGAFLGEQVRTVNMWLALGRCGRTAPGLDLVPRRIDRVVETGSGDAIFDWSVSTDVVAEEAGDAGVVRPEFGPGDALLFDHLFLHSTAVEPDMTHERHAIETWFFAPSAYPQGQIPLVY